MEVKIGVLSHTLLYKKLDSEANKEEEEEDNENLDEELL